MGPRAKGYSKKEIPLAEQNKFIEVMKATIRKFRKGHSPHNCFCAYGELIITMPESKINNFVIFPAKTIHIIRVETMVSLIDTEQQERKGQMYVEVPFTRKRDFEKAKEMFLEYQNATKDDRKHNPQKYA